ncbi:ppGpp synthetase/RelA/SpoT-type nucleotidyltransferase [Blastococcus colisei]|uniref:PpGpp synthetase/RelA/SpoT-type nucleotidyltransferase n=1 Tax=Blastococcus colisei TaxID=1564162 RepID=A0A543NZU8_9ACTN|nr:ppGpp synthetase/RelA/SpoT-type nucleotidyltransferase [Blastococcus colisei]
MPGRVCRVEHPGIKLPASRSQLARLGERLARDEERSGDLDLYEETLDAYDQAQVFVKEILDNTDWSAAVGGLAVTGRTKSIDTLLQKLQRTPGLRLPYIHDIAGVRVVADFTLTTQGVFARGLCGSFDVEDKLIDRIRSPQSGYRALHLVTFVSGIPVEIQLRTRLQSLWADVFERLADSVGRQIRYGEPPDHDADDDADKTVEIVEGLELLSTGVIAEVEKLDDQLAPLRPLLEQERLGPLLEAVDFEDAGIPPGTDVLAWVADLELRAREAKEELERQLLRVAEVLQRPSAEGEGA